MIIVHKCGRPDLFYTFMWSSWLKVLNRLDAYKIFTRRVVRRPFGEEILNAPCMKDGKCTIRLSRAYIDQKFTDVDDYSVYRVRDDGKLLSTQKVAVWTNAGSFRTIFTFDASAMRTTMSRKIERNYAYIILVELSVLSHWLSKNGFADLFFRWSSQASFQIQWQDAWSCSPSAPRREQDQAVHQRATSLCTGTMLVTSTL